MIELWFRRSIARFLLAVFAGWLILAGPSQGAKLCYDCHKVAKDAFSSKKIIHQPVKEGNCESCHKRHGFANNLVLVDNTSQLCYSCHGDLKARFAEGNVHSPVEKGVCWDCHDPHASDKKALMRKGPEGADDPFTCMVCHKKDLAGTVGAKYAHEPFEKLQCITCHDPHNSSAPSLLKAEASALCANCHKVTDKKILAAHQDKHIENLRCDECHTGHSSNSKGLLSDRAHPPFSDGECTQCHSLPDAGGKVSFAEGKTAGSLCQDCHQEQVTKTKAKYSHPAVEAANCDNFHSGHSSPSANLLKRPEEKICSECHSDLIKGQGLTAHAPVVAGDCGKCHDVHGSDNEHLLKSSGSALCLGCHIEFKAAKDSASVIHAGAEDCLQCHNPHEGQTKAILKKPPEELCRDCHEIDAKATTAMSAHPPYLTANCVGCHLPHFSRKPHLVRGDGNTLWLNCHSEINQLLNFPVTHPPAKEDCLTCHKPHYSEKNNLLVDDEGKLCQTCHDPADLKVTKEFVHTPVGEGDCTGCHNPHGSIQPKLVTGRAMPVNEKGVTILRTPILTGKSADLCYSCHESLEQQFRIGIVHKPVAAGNCEACHEVHGSDHYGLIKEEPAALCGTCHAINDSLETKHNNYNLKSANCVDCHNPHASPNPKLVRATSHSPFSEKMCDDCHTREADGTVKLVSEMGTLCASCHDVTEKNASKKNHHAPFESGDCTSCHSPHASDNKHMLKREGSSLCMTCHDDMKALKKESVQHPPFEKGQCLDCHNPHASDFPKLTSKPPESFCFGCHTELKDQIAKGAAHSPARSGNCTACHLPHAGEQASLLKETKQALCTKCHDLKSAGAVSAHHGFDVANSDCQNCHAAHATRPGTKSLLLPDTHAPFVSRNCSQCHSSQGKNELIADVPELCLNCHESFKPEMSRAVVHEPLTEKGGCTGCHGPHVGFGKSLQKKDGVLTCLTCHTDKEFKGSMKHKAAFEDCTTCHQPHSSDNKWLLDESDLMELCTACHPDARKTHFHPMGEGTTDPRTREPVNCVSCHSPHSSDFKPLLIADKNRKLCVLCHDVNH